MQWHKKGKRESEDPDIMTHPADGDAWKALDHFNPEFRRDPRNVRLGFLTDGFTLFSTSNSSYSCWPVFVMPYNLPPNMRQSFQARIIQERISICSYIRSLKS